MPLLLVVWDDSQKSKTSKHISSKTRTTPEGCGYSHIESRNTRPSRRLIRHTGEPSGQCYVILFAIRIRNIVILQAESPFQVTGTDFRVLRVRISGVGTDFWEHGYWFPRLHVRTSGFTCYKRGFSGLWVRISGERGTYTHAFLKLVSHRILLF